MSAETLAVIGTPTDSSSVYPPPSCPPPVMATIFHEFDWSRTSQGPPDIPAAIPVQAMSKNFAPASV